MLDLQKKQKDHQLEMDSMRIQADFMMKEKLFRKT